MIDGSKQSVPLKGFMGRAIGKPKTVTPLTRDRYVHICQLIERRIPAKKIAMQLEITTKNLYAIVRRCNKSGKSPFLIEL